MYPDDRNPRYPPLDQGYPWPSESTPDDLTAYADNPDYGAGYGAPPPSGSMRHPYGSRPINPNPNDRGQPFYPPQQGAQPPLPPNGAYGMRGNSVGRMPSGPGDGFQSDQDAYMGGGYPQGGVGQRGYGPIMPNLPDLEDVGQGGYGQGGMSQRGYGPFGQRGYSQSRYGQAGQASQMRASPYAQPGGYGQGAGAYGANSSYGANGVASPYGQPYYRLVQLPAANANSVVARQDRIKVWSLPYLFVVIIGIGSLFTFFDIFDINVSFLQTCQDIIAGCTIHNAAQFLGMPVLLNLAGYVVGALILSPLADRFGRRDMLLYTLVLTGVGSLLNGFVGNYTEFIMARAITGIGVGADLVLVNTYINEVAPREGRARYTSLILVLSSIGAVLGIWGGLFLTTPAAPFPYGLPFALNVTPFGWRILYFIGAALMLVGISLRAQLPESPRWLVARGRVNDADVVVRAMEERAAQRAPLPSAMDEIPVKTGRMEAPFELLFKNPLYIKRVALLLAVWLTAYVTVYSYIAGLATILGALGYSASEAGLIVAIGVTGFIIASVVCYYLSERIERKYWLPLAAVLSLIGGALLATVGPTARSGGELLIAFGGAMFVFAGLIWLAPTYSWSTENFPTRARTTGFGIVDGIGHIGGGVGILLIAPYLQQLGPWQSFLVIDAFLVVSAIIAQFGPSTRGKRLDIVSP